jgi:hypothetical protein
MRSFYFVVATLEATQARDKHDAMGRTLGFYYGYGSP